MLRRRRHGALRIGLAVLLLLSGAGNLENIAAVSDPSSGQLDDVPSTTPSNLGDVDLTELQYGDPAEGLDLIQPPQANVEGSASVAHPLAIPAGRADVQPDLALTYDSNGGSGWVGTGWDVSVGAITVDTAFGAPRYLPNHESETYLLDGDRLFPNAIRTDLESRQDGPRSDWVRQVEDTHELIIRHGDGPRSYCWEVVDKVGTHRWYGGEPDADGGCERNTDAILTAPSTGVAGTTGGDYHWALTYVEDISGNVMRFGYDELSGVEIGRAGADFGVSLYLRTIIYTGFKESGDLPDQPAYRVDFLRDGDVDDATRRKDITVDASTGQPVVVRDLLRRIEVSYLSPEHYSADAEPELVKGWTLEYVNGPFDKSLLTRIGQFGSGGAGAEHAWHEFTWFDDVRDSSGEYEGFSSAEQWDTRDDTLLPNIAADSALGASWRIGADGGSYIGFNPVAPSKNGSFGGSFNIAGGVSHDVSTLVDLDGDGLPDKVWVDASGTVMYRANLHRPGGSKHSDDSWFGPTRTIDGIDNLGRSIDLRVDVHFEAYPVVAIQVGGGFGFSFGDTYFEDVNGDGRVDFIQPGSGGLHTVFYNVLGDNNIPKFIDSSLADELVDTLEVPLDSFDSDLASAEIDEVSDLIVNTSPRIDTVRRWLAPHTGTIRVAGGPELTTGSAYLGDGVLTTVEHGGEQRWTATLDKDTTSASHDVTFDVAAGQPVWFRAHVIANASDDEVAWDPTITYIAGDGIELASVDANNRSQVTFDASDDFTLFGRTGARTGLVEPGLTTVNVTVATLEELSDDLDVVVLHGRGDEEPTEHAVMTVDRNEPAGSTTGSVDLTVTAPATDPGDDGQLGTRDDVEESDYFELEVTSDSPVDPTAFSIEASTTQPGIEPPDLSGLPDDADLDIPLDLPIVPNVRVFARTDHTQPYVPVTAPDEDDLNPAAVSATVGGLPLTLDPEDAAKLSSSATLTVKTLEDGVVARSEFTVAHIISPGPDPVVVGLGGSASLDFTPKKKATYYVDVSVADPTIGAAVDLTDSSVIWRWTETDSEGISTQHSESVADAGQLHWPDTDGMFPSANRGWAYAGYNADHADSDGAGPLVETQFRFDSEAEGLDEDTEVPTADEAPSAADVKAEVGSSFDRALPYIPWAASGGDVADRWRAAGKETLHGRAGTMQADRLGADTPVPGLTTDGREAPQMLSLSGDFNFMLGLVATFTAAIGGGRELRGYEDYNGDGYPDIRSGANIEYTGPRGSKATSTGAGSDPFDMSLALGGGISGSAVAISSSGGSSKNDDGGGGGSNVEPTSTKSSRGMNVGLGFDIDNQWTNPLGPGDIDVADNGNSDAPDIRGDFEAERGAGAPMDQAMIDMNGDGLPDRVETDAIGNLYVYLNLGYRFAGDAIEWSTGRTAANIDTGGALSIGFQFNAYEFAGGVSYSESVGFSQFDWADIDGDGVPDRMSNSGADDPATVFGSGDGMEGGAVTYGDFPDGEVSVDPRLGDAAIPLPEGQMEVSRSTGLTGGVDFSFYIGPLCKVACYIVVNPGVHAGYDRMTSQVGMVDMNGDGYVDAVRSTDRDHVEVQLNQRRRTNMLQSVTNPLGGQMRLDYERTGNTIDNPESLWVMSSVEFDDGRHGDGVSVQRSEFTYAGNAYDRLLRDLLGFSTIREDQLDTDGSVLRSYESDYLNGNPFETGTMIEERTLDADGHIVTASKFTWAFTNADPTSPDYGAAVVDVPARSTTARLQLFDMALSPRLVTDELMSWDDGGRDDPAAKSQQATTHYSYNVIGDVVTVHEENEHEVDADDTFTVLTYPPCADRSGDRTLGPDDTWVSVPQTVTVYGNDEASGERLKHRNGGPDLCGNSVPIRIAELVSEASGDCGPLVAITELSFDDYGSYNSVARPANVVPASCDQYPSETIDSADVTYDGCDTLSAEDDATRYCVDYVYDPHRFTDIATVTDNHGVSSSATYDPHTGRQASRTDENGNLTTFTYDPQGRLSSITAPREQGGGSPTLSFAYGGLDATLDPAGAHAWATAHHHDIFNPGTTIDTVTFVDGMDRVVQRKRDAEVEGVDGESRIVEGAIDYDALGREVREWYPVVETDADFAPTTYNTWNSQTGADITHVPVTEPVQRQYTTLDSLRFQQLPDGSQETIDYDFEVLPDPAGTYSAPITMQRVTFTDPLGKESTQWRDVGGATFRREDKPIGANAPDGADGPLASLPGPDVLVDPRVADSTGTPGPIITDYEYDRLARLTAVIDAAGARTAHTYSRGDAVTSTDTPDAGLVQRTFAPSGQMLTVERANGTVANYAYDRDRLVGVGYSDDTPEVVYEFGGPDAAENAAGRVTTTIDGAMERTYGYDVDGNVARETATMDEDPFGKGVDDDPPTWETAWSYDSLGRIEVLTYPTGEDLHYDYDLGGRPSRLASQAPQHDLYDQYGDTVERDDVEIVYLDEVRYDQFGEVTYLRTGTGVETRYEREPTRRFLAGIATDSTAIEQFDGTMSTARPLQQLEYSYDAVGNVRDVANRLYAEDTDTAITDLGPPPENNVPGPSQQAYTYDGHYRLTGAVGTYVDRKENRDFTYETDFAANGNLLSKRQVTTTTNTSGNGRGGNKDRNPNAKKGSGTGTDSGTTEELTCESDTGSGGGSFNQDPETTYVLAPGDMEYATDGQDAPIHQLVRAGTRDYSYDDNGNMTGWIQDCAKGTADISRTLEWDAENRLTRIAEDNNDTDYRYNAEGARTLERGPGGTNWFVNEHWQTFNDGLYYASVYLGEQRVAIHRTDPQPPPPAPCTDTEEVTCPLDDGDAWVVESMVECPATRVFDADTSTCQPRDARKLYFLHTDLQGSMRVATDQVGGVFQYMDYLPTGRPWVAGQDTTKDTPYLFAGGWTDRTYDLVNFGARWYDAREQNFVTPDPVLEEDPYATVDDPALLAAYTYAASNPLRYVDPDGRASTAAAGNRFDVGTNHEKHKAGNIRISPSVRAKIDSPAITFRGRYSNNANGQKLFDAFEKHKDRADRFTTVLSISTEDGVRKIRVFGITTSKKDVGTSPAPNPGPANTGSSPGQAAPASPPVNTGAPAPPTASTTAGPTTSATSGGASSSASAATTPPPSARSGPPSTGSSTGTGTAASTSPQPSRPPANNSPRAPGPSG